MEVQHESAMNGISGSVRRWLARVASVVVLAGAAAGSMAPGAGAMSLVKIESGRPGAATFLMEGTFATGDVDRLRQALLKLPANTAAAVIFNSPGGNLLEGINLGALIYESRVATFVKSDGGICHSACSLAFLAGRSPRTGEPMRIKPTGSHLGFHQFRRGEYDPLKVYTKPDFEAEIAHAQEVSKVIVRYLKLIGEDLGKLQLMLRAPAEGMNVISDDECLARGISVLDEGSGRVMLPGSQRQRVSSL
jgi:hypothetical protein